MALERLHALEREMLVWVLLHMGEIIVTIFAQMCQELHVSAIMEIGRQTNRQTDRQTETDTK